MRKGTNMKRISIAVLALVIGALVLAGCGGSSGSSSGGSTSESTTTASSSGSETATGEGKGGMFNISEEAKACLKEKGLELPGFKGGEGGPPGAAEGEMPEPGEKPEGGEMPEGGPPAGGFGGERSEEMTKAFEECGVEMPEFKGGPGGATAGGTRPNVNSAAFKKQVKEYVACVRENGYELAEPNFSGEGPIFEKAESESAEFKKASAQCQELLGGPQTTEPETG
jgi:hypothetical protein